MAPARARSEDPYKRLFWVVVTGVVMTSGGGFASFISMRVDGATLRTELGALKVDVQALKEQSPVYSEAVTMLRVLTTQVSEIRTSLSESTRDRYTGSQASSDRKDLQDRITRLEEHSAKIDVWKAEVETRIRSDAQFTGGK